MHPRSAPPRSPSCGSAARTLIFVLLALVLLAGGLWWVLGGSDSTTPVANGAAPAAPVADEEPLAVVAVPEGERIASESVRSVTSDEGLAVQVGVRLQGTGKLIGTVLERETGGGVSGASVELHVMPPSATKWFKTVMTLGSFFAIGALKSRWSLSAWWRSALETLVIGGVAAGIAFGVGTLFHV